MTSSILPPRSDFAPCSPSTQAIASTTLDLPEPLGPTTAVMPGSKRNVVAEAKDLKPLRVRLFRCTRGSRLCFAPDPGQGHGVRRGRGRPGQTLPAAAVDPGRPARDPRHPSGWSSTARRRRRATARPVRPRSRIPVIATPGVPPGPPTEPSSGVDVVPGRSTV